MARMAETPMSWLMVMAVLLSCSHVSSQSYSMQGAAVRILFPPGHRSTSIDMAMADFGRAEYGASLIGKLFYPSEDPAYNPTGKSIRCPSSRCEYGCDDFSTANPPFAIQKKPNELAIMLIDRGPQNSAKPCYFITKAYNAQLAGADAVLVVDDSDNELTTAVVPDMEEVAHLLANLTASLALITRKDGNLLKSLLKDQANVVLSLNWTSLEPRRSKVSWELWTTTNDQCGTLCKEQANFITGIKALSRSMSQSNETDFSPHYLLWSCPSEYAQSVECQNECIMNGKYCVPDPDGNQTAGYSGAEVLAMNVRHMCYYRVAREAGTPWLWWDFADLFHSMCKSSAHNFTTACAQEVFVQVSGPMLFGGQGQAKWDACIANGTAPPPGSRITTLPLLEDELLLQQGDTSIAPVTILPTVRINGKQFRGTLDVKGVVRALCSAFPLGEEPTVCNDKSISDNECQPDAVGHANCRVGDPDAKGNTRCINTFSGYKCECGQGWVRTFMADTGEETCEDINECLSTNVMLTNPQCGCDRCACINLIGSYKCTGTLPNKCTAEYNYGGCWKAPWDGQQAHACIDTYEAYKSQAARGTLRPDQDWFTCACPACFNEVVLGATGKDLTCAAQCSANLCIKGVCTVAPTPGPTPTPSSGTPTPTPSSGAGGSGGGSMSGTGIFFTVLLTVGFTTGALFAVYHYVLRQRMEGEIRDIMSQYMPLDPRGGNSGPPRAGGGRGGGAALSPVHEGIEDTEEDTPLMGAAPAAGSGAVRFGAAPVSGNFRPPKAPASTSAPAPPNRTAYGGLVSPAQHNKPASGYQPPAPVPEEDSDSSGLTSGQAANLASALPSTTAKRGAVSHSAPSSTAAPLGSAPLLGEGPL